MSALNYELKAIGRTIGILRTLDIKYRRTDFGTQLNNAPNYVYWENENLVVVLSYGYDDKGKKLKKKKKDLFSFSNVIPMENCIQFIFSKELLEKNKTFNLKELDPESIQESCSGDKKREFKELRVRYGTGQSQEGTRVIGWKRNGSPRYEAIYRHGMMTELGDLENSEWESRARMVINKYGEDAILKRLIDYTTETFPFMNDQDIQVYALKLHMARIFENRKWLYYDAWHESVNKKEDNNKTIQCFRCVMYMSHRCRNEKKCPDGYSFEEYTGSKVKQCLCATVEVFQDGYIHCPVLDCTGCEKCMEEFGDGSSFVYDESQNYEREPRWLKV